MATIYKELTIQTTAEHVYLGARCRRSLRRGTPHRCSDHAGEARAALVGDVV